MWAAVFGFFGVVVGAVVAGGVSLWRELFITSREREARQTLREQEQRDRRNTFQRESILALQDVLGELHKAVGHEQDRMYAAAEGADVWPTRAIEIPVPEDFLLAHRAITKLQARIFRQGAPRVGSRHSGRVERHHLR